MQGTDRIFTGTSALHMVKEHYDKNQSKKIDDRHWRMYIFKEFGEMYQMKKYMYILYEIEVCYTACFLYIATRHAV